MPLQYWEQTYRQGLGLGLGSGLGVGLGLGLGLALGLGFGFGFGLGLGLGFGLNPNLAGGMRIKISFDPCVLHRTRRFFLLSGRNGLATRKLTCGQDSRFKIQDSMALQRGSSPQKLKRQGS